MAITKTEIFIASRFDEFAELRSLLAQRINQFPVFPLQAVDLNDGVAGSAPPLGKCIAAVKRAEVMILLVGDTYGGTPPDHDLSFTHLEYRTAASENSQTVLLPFFISKANVENKFHGFSTDPKLGAWQKEIMDNHTPAFLDAAEDARILCQVIFDCAYKALYDSRTNAVQQQMDLSSTSEDLDPDDADLTIVPSAGDDSLGLSHNDMERLDDAFHGDEVSLFDTGESYYEKMPDILQRPAEIASLEQKREAFKALELGDRFIAIQHFRRAREHRPLDFSSTYWLARLLAASGKTNDSREAIRYSLLAAKMANYDQRPVKAAASLIIASKAASKIDEYEEALEYAKKAVEETPWLATARIELAARLASLGAVDDALKEVRRAFLRLPQSMIMANREPSLIKLGKHYQEFKKNIREQLFHEVMSLYNNFVELNRIVAESDQDNINKSAQAKIKQIASKPLINLFFEGKAILRDHLRLLQDESSKLLGALNDHTLSNINSIVSKLISSILTFERNSLQCQLLSVGKNIKSAKLGDVLTIDTVLHVDVLKSAIVDDAIVPPSLGDYAVEIPASLGGRKRLYRLLDYRDGRPLLSRCSVYFDTLDVPDLFGNSFATWDNEQMKYLPSRHNKTVNSVAWLKIRESGGVGTLVTGTITSKTANGFCYMVDVDGIEALLPSSQIDSPYIGMIGTFKVMIQNEDNGSLVLTTH